MTPRIERVLAAWLIFSAGCSQSESIESSAPIFDAETYINEWVGFWNTYNLDRVDELFLNDARLTYFSSELEGLISGMDAVWEHHAGFRFVSGGREPEQELWVEDVRSSDYGSTAVVTARWFFGDRSVERDSISQGPMTAVYTLDGDGYKIAHMHFATY